MNSQQTDFTTFMKHGAARMSPPLRIVIL